MVDADEAAARVDTLLDEIDALGDARARQLARDLVAAVTTLQGLVVARMLDVLQQQEWPTAQVPGADGSGAGVVHRLAADPLVSSLLALHGLHPLPVAARVEAALDTVRPAVADGDVRVLALDEAAGTVRVRLLSGSPLMGSIERRVRSVLAAAAPELTEVVLEGPAVGPLVVPPGGGRPVPMGAAPTAPTATAAADAATAAAAADPLLAAPAAGPATAATADPATAAAAADPPLAAPPGVPVRLRRRPSLMTASEDDPRCDLCASPTGPGHAHLVDLQDRRVLCACRPCALLFSPDGAGGVRYRTVPDRVVAIDGVLDEVDWDALDIPVSVAFFLRNSVLGRVVACYPGPAGATESLLPLDTFATVEARHPVLGELAPDVEGLLVRRSDTGVEAFIVPITSCYELVGTLRRCWRGLDGGSEARRAVDRFFGGLADRSVRVPA